MRKVWSKIYPSSPIPDFSSKNMSPSKTGSNEKISQYWTPSLKNLVAERYDLDFVMLEYEK